MEAPSTPPTARTRCGRPHTPPSPKHGSMYDEWTPYSPRRSSRQTLLSNPYSTFNVSSKPISNGVPPLYRTPAKLPHSFNLNDSIVSPPNSPIMTMPGSHRGLLIPPSRAGDSSNNTAIDNTDPSSSSRKPSSMLPTPSKTPNMTPARKHSRAASMQDTARILHFQPDDPNDVMPTRREKRTMRHGKTSGFDLNAEDYEEPSRSTANGNFQIYTESQARVPELDESEENVFYRPRATTIPQTRSSPRRSRKTIDQIMEERAMDDAATRNEGIVYSFRGKKIFKRFEESDYPASSSADPGATAHQRSLKRSVGAAAHVPLTRSQIRPRLLFQEHLLHDTDEEAETDVEMSDAPSDAVPTRLMDPPTRNPIFTPAKKAQPPPMMSPPTASRASRKKNVDVPVFEDEPEPVETPQRIAGAAPPTPQRSSRKRVQISSIPIFQEGTPEPAAAEDAGIITAAPPTPARTTRKKIEVRLAPVIEEDPESADKGRSTPVPSFSGGSRKSRSPFDSWPRTKKREGGVLEGAVGKRTRSGTNLNATPT